MVDRIVVSIDHSKHLPSNAEKESKGMGELIRGTLHARHRRLATAGTAISLRIQAKRHARFPYKQNSPTILRELSESTDPSLPCGLTIMMGLEGKGCCVVA